MFNTLYAKLQLTMRRRAPPRRVRAGSHPLALGRGSKRRSAGATTVAALLVIPAAS